ncbi:hypothetical protein FS842_010646 [Serendipita sp. 407]|nr:hypothetical protein FS842_010646 [Serendipita sp. 407]
MDFQRPISYQDFLSSNGGLLNDNGPWMVRRSYVDDINCGSINPWFCTDVPSCLSCWVFPSATQTSYSVSFHTKVAFDLSQYGGATTLEYEWSYTPWFGRTSNAAGKVDVTTSVGDNFYTDEIDEGDVLLLLRNQTGWNYTPFKRSGSMKLSTNDAQTIGYIPLSINITFSRQSNQYIDFYVKGAALRIITQTASITLSGGISPSSTALTTISSSSQSNKITVGALVGSILGTVVLVTLIILGFLFFWMRKVKRDTSKATVTGTAPIPLQTHVTPTTPFTSYSGGGAPLIDRGNPNRSTMFSQQASSSGASSHVSSSQIVYPNSPPTFILDTRGSVQPQVQQVRPTIGTFGQERPLEAQNEQSPTQLRRRFAPEDSR